MSLTKLRKMQWNLKHKLKNNRGKTSKISHYYRKPADLGGGRPRSWWPACTPSVRRFSRISRRAISSVSASSIASFSVMSRSSLVLNRFWSIYMMLSGVVPSHIFQSRFLFWRMKIVHRTRAVPFHVRAGIRKCIRIRALSASNISVGKYVERIGVVGQTANMGVVKHFLAELIQSFSA